MHKIITISGSMRYWEEILNHATKLSVEGNIVLIPFNDPDEENIPEFRKKMHDEVHNERIEMSDELFVVNKDCYIGNNTIKEILHAFRNNKYVNFLERPSWNMIVPILSQLTDFERMQVFHKNFRYHMKRLIEKLCIDKHRLDAGLYNFPESAKFIHRDQMELDRISELARECMKEKYPIVEAMFQSELGKICDECPNIPTDFIKLSMWDYLYSTSSELLISSFEKSILSGKGCIEYE